MSGYDDYSPFRGGYVYSNPYEITSYVCKQTFYQDTDRFYMEIKCSTDKTVIELCNYAYTVMNDEAPDMNVCSYPNIKTVCLQSRYKSALDTIRRWIIRKNRYIQSRLNYLVNDCAITQEMTEIYDCITDRMTFDLNVGRCNGKTTRNAEEVFKKKMKLYFDNKPVEIVNQGTIFKLCPSPKKIIFSGPKCIVIWTDDTKTIVSCGENDNWDEYAAYCAALAKKIYGTTSAVHRLVNKKSNVKEYKEAQELSEKVISHITPPDPFNDIRKEKDNDR